MTGSPFATRCVSTGGLEVLLGAPGAVVGSSSIQTRVNDRDIVSLFRVSARECSQESLHQRETSLPSVSHKTVCTRLFERECPTGVSPQQRRIVSIKVFARASSKRVSIDSSVFHVSHTGVPQKCLHKRVFQSSLTVSNKSVCTSVSSRRLTSSSLYLEKVSILRFFLPSAKLHRGCRQLQTAADGCRHDLTVVEFVGGCSIDVFIWFVFEWDNKHQQAPRFHHALMYRRCTANSAGFCTKNDQRFV